MVNTTASSLTIGLLRHKYTCIPNSLKTFLECGGYDVDHYVLQAVTIDHQVNFVVLNDVSSAGTLRGNYVDTSSLIGQLRQGMMDSVLLRLTVSELRAKYFDYGLPSEEQELCFFVGRHWLNDTFPATIWLIIISLVALYVMIKLLNCITPNNMKMKLFHRFRQISFGIALTCGVVMFNLNLKVGFMPKTRLKRPFNTVNELAELVRTNNYYMAIDKLGDYRMELINKSRNTAIRALKKELHQNNIKLVESKSAIWNEVKDNRNAFTMAGWTDFLLHCQPKIQAHILEICPHELPKQAVSYGFSKHSKLVDTFNRRIHFIYGLWQKAFKTWTNWYIYHVSQNDQTSKTPTPIILGNMWLLFALFVLSSLSCVIAFYCEHLFIHTVKPSIM